MAQKHTNQILKLTPAGASDFFLPARYQVAA